MKNGSHEGYQPFYTFSGKFSLWSRTCLYGRSQNESACYSHDVQALLRIQLPVFPICKRHYRFDSIRQSIIVLPTNNRTLDKFLGCHDLLTPPFLYTVRVIDPPTTKISHHDRFPIQAQFSKMNRVFQYIYHQISQGDRCK
jgi:hypothetical protein